MHATELVPMNDYSDPILIRGRYQVVALIPHRGDEPGNILRYVVLTSGGAAVRHEVSLDDARIWMETLHEEEILRRPVVPPRVSRAKRFRR